MRAIAHVKGRLFAPDPADELLYLVVREQGFKRVIMVSELPLCEHRMDLAVANGVH